MSNFLNIIDKYKFGLLAALAAYMAIFMYLQMESYTQYFAIEAFHDGSYVDVPEEDIFLKPENIMVPSGYNSEVKNMARDENDPRERAYENYSQNQEQIDAEYKALEEKMYEEAGGSKTRAEIREEMEQRKIANENSDIKPTNTQNNTNVAYAGNVMVDWNLSSRTAHQKNNWYVRNPGYTCGYGATGKVTVIIKVNQNGSVTNVEYDASQSVGASSCMIKQATKYAKISRFSYSASAPKLQTGRITYTFIAQ